MPDILTDADMADATPVLTDADMSDATPVAPKTTPVLTDADMVDAKPVTASASPQADVLTDADMLDATPALPTVTDKPAFSAPALQTRLSRKQDLIGKLEYLQKNTPDDAPDEEGMTLAERRGLVESSDFNTGPEDAVRMVSDPIERRYQQAVKAKGPVATAVDALKRGYESTGSMIAGGAKVLAPGELTAEDKDLLRAGAQASREYEIQNPKVVGGVQDIRGIGDAAKFAIEAVAENLPRALPAVAGGLVGGIVAGPPGAMVGAGLAGLAQNTGEAIQDQANEGRDLSKGYAMAQGAGYSLVDAVIGGEANVAMRMARGIAKPALEMAKKEFVSSLKDVGKAALKTGLREGVSEPLQSQGVKRALDYKRFGSAKTPDEKTTKEMILAGVNESVGGFLAGLFLGGAESANQYRGNAKLMRDADKAIGDLAMDTDVAKMNPFDKTQVARYVVGRAQLNDLNTRLENENLPANRKKIQADIDRVTGAMDEIENVADDETKTVLNAYNSQYTKTSLANVPSSVAPTFASTADQVDAQMEDAGDGTQIFTDKNSGIAIVYQPLSIMGVGKTRQITVVNNNGLRMPHGDNTFDTIDEAVAFAKDLSRLNSFRVSNNAAKAKFISSLTAKSHPGANLVQVDSPAQIENPKARARMLGGEQAFYSPDDNTVYAILDAIDSQAQAAIILNHENFHAAFEDMLKAQGKTRAQVLGTPDKGGQRTVEEILAGIGERTFRDMTRIEKATSAIASWIQRTTGVKTKVTQADIRLLVQQVRDHQKTMNVAGKQEYRVDVANKTVPMPEPVPQTEAPALTESPESQAKRLAQFQPELPVQQPLGDKTTPAAAVAQQAAQEAPQSTPVEPVPSTPPAVEKAPDARINPKDKMQRESFKSFFKAANQNGEYDLLQRWHEGNGLFGLPDKNAGGEYDAYRALPQKMRKLIRGKSKREITSAAKEIAEELGPEYADPVIGPELLVNEFVRQYGVFQGWKENGAVPDVQADEAAKRANAAHRQEQEDLATYRKMVDNGGVIADGTPVYANVDEQKAKEAGVDPDFPAMIVQSSYVKNGVLAYELKAANGKVIDAYADSVDKRDISSEVEYDESERDYLGREDEAPGLVAGQVQVDSTENYDADERAAIEGETGVLEKGAEAGSATGEVAAKGKNDGSLFAEADIPFNLDGGEAEDVVRISAEKKAEEDRQAEAKRKLDEAPVLPGIDAPVAVTEKPIAETQKPLPSTSDKLSSSDTGKDNAVQTGTSSITEEGTGTQRSRADVGTQFKRGTKAVATLPNGTIVSGEVKGVAKDGKVEFRAFKVRKFGSKAFTPYPVNADGTPGFNDSVVDTAKVRPIDAAADVSKLTPEEKRKLKIAEMRDSVNDRKEIRAGEQEAPKDKVDDFNNAKEREERKRNGEDAEFRFQKPIIDGSKIGRYNLNRVLKPVKGVSNALENTVSDIGRKVAQQLNLGASAPTLRIVEPVSNSNHAVSVEMERSALAEIERIFDKQIVFVDAGTIFDAMTWKKHPKLVLVNARATAPALQLLGHELSHTMEVDAPELFWDMADELSPLLFGSDETKKQVSRIVNKSQTKTNDYAREQFGELLGQNFTNAEFWNKVQQRNPTLFARVANFITKWIDKTLSAWRGDIIDVTPYYTDMEEARKILAKTLVGYGEIMKERKERRKTDNGQPMFRRVTPEQDAAYLDAVQKGDMETALRMVYEAAKAAGYNIGPVWHGSSDTSINTFKGSRFGIDLFFFSPSREFASNYIGDAPDDASKYNGKKRKTLNPGTRSFFLKIKNVATSKDIGRAIVNRMKKVPYDDYGSLYNYPESVILEGIGYYTDVEHIGVLKAIREAGYDGFVVSESLDQYGRNTHHNYAVFDSSQIKSSDPVTYDDQGNVIPLSERFNDRSDDIRFRTAGGTQDDRYIPKDRDAYAAYQSMRRQEQATKEWHIKRALSPEKIKDFLASKFWNWNDPIYRRIRADVKNKGKAKNEVVDQIIRSEDAVRGASGRALERLDDVAKKIVGLGIKTRDQMSELNDIRLARRVIEVDEIHRKKTQDKIDKIKESGEWTDKDESDWQAELNGFKQPKGLTVENSKALLRYKEANSPDWAKMEQANDLIQKQYVENVDKLFDNGIITKDFADYLKTHKYYQPRMFLDKIDPVVDKGSGRSTSVHDSGIEALRMGAESPLLNDSMYLLGRNTAHVEGRIARNTANKHLYGFIESEPDNSLGARIVSDADMKNPVEKGYDRIAWQDNGVTKAFDIPSELAVFWKTSDPALDEASAKLLRWGTGVAPLKFMATAGNPEFAIGNIFRDLGLQWFSTKNYSPFLPVSMAEQMRNFVSELNPRRYAKIRDQYIKHGGSTEYLTTQGMLSDLHQHGAITAGNRHANSVMKLMGWIGSRSEEMSRLMLTDQALRKMGKTVDNATDLDWDKAVHEGSNYLDFRQHGQFMKVVDQIVPFANPAAQGVRVVLRAFKDRPGETTFKAMQIMLIGALIAWWNRKEDEEGWESVNDQEKNTKAVFNLGMKSKDANGNLRSAYLGIPIDQGWRPFFVLGELIAEKLQGKEIDPNRMVSVTYANYAPMDLTNLPPIVSALLTYTQNHDFWRNEAVWRGRKVDPEAERRASTPELANKVADITGLSPERLKAASGKLIPANPWTSAISDVIDYFGKSKDLKAQEDDFAYWSQVPMARRIMRLTPVRELRHDDILSARKLGVKINGRPVASVLKDIDRAERIENTKRQHNDYRLDVMAAAVKAGKATRADLFKVARDTRKTNGAVDSKEIRRLILRIKDKYRDIK